MYDCEKCDDCQKYLKKDISEVPEILENCVCDEENCQLLDNCMESDRNDSMTLMEDEFEDVCSECGKYDCECGFQQSQNDLFANTPYPSKYEEKLCPYDGVTLVPRMLDTDGTNLMEMMICVECDYQERVGN